MILDIFKLLVGLAGDEYGVVLVEDGGGDVYDLL